MKEKYLVMSRIAIMLSVALLLIQCESSTRLARGTEPAAAAVTNLTDLAQLKQAFERDRGKVRLVALLSPV